MKPEHTVKRDASGEPLVDQGLVHGFPCTYNPDDFMFYIHRPGTTDGTAVRARFADWRNAVQYARRQSLKGGDAAGKGA